MSNFWGDAGGGATIVLAVVAIFSKPALKFRDKRRDEKMKQKSFDLWMQGRPEIPGIAPEIISAPLEMVVMKNDISELKHGMSEVKRTLVRVEGVLQTVKSTTETVDYKITKNGENSNNIGDMVARVARVSGVMDDDPESSDNKEKDT